MHTNKKLFSLLLFSGLAALSVGDAWAADKFDRLNAMGAYANDLSEVYPKAKAPTESPATRATASEKRWEPASPAEQQRVPDVTPKATPDDGLTSPFGIHRIQR